MLRSMFGSCPRAAQEHPVNYTFQRAAQEQLKVFNERSRGSLLMMTLMAMMTMTAVHRVSAAQPDTFWLDRTKC